MQSLSGFKRDDGVSRQLRGAICSVLCQQWDPLGIGRERAGRETYGALVPALFIMLMDDFTAEEIALYLMAMERGFDRPTSVARPPLQVTEALCSLRTDFNLPIKPRATSGEASLVA